jgi:hypothetical protein
MRGLPDRLRPRTAWLLWSFPAGWLFYVAGVSEGIYAEASR